MSEAEQGKTQGAPLTGHTGAVTALALGERQGQVIVSGSGDNAIRIWDHGMEPMVARRLNVTYPRATHVRHLRSALT